MLSLNARYGASKSFDEESFISELVKEVHPDLQNFFSSYIEGKNQWKPNEQLNYIGITYNDSIKENSILNPLNDADNDLNCKALGIGLERVVVKCGPKEWAGLKVGDIVSVSDYRDAFEPRGNKLNEGDVAKLKVKRNKEIITLDIPVKYGMKEKKNVLRWMEKK
jgi:predicted metalloprotease with PDZ domain